MSPTIERGLDPARLAVPNGAVAIVQETRTTPAVTIDATFRAGNFWDPPSLPGVAFLLSRVIDRGTRERGADAIAELLDERGVTLRIVTTRHTLSIACSCLAEDFDDLLSLVVDVARAPVFPDGEIDKRRAETITAIRQDEDNPAVRAVEAALELMYGAGHPYARRAKGTVESLERVDRSSLASFHRARVIPAALSLVVVGDVRAGHAFDRISAALSGWIGPAPDLAVVPPPLPASGRRRRVVAMPGKPQTDIAYGFTTIRRLDPRYYAYWLMNNLFGQYGLGGRLADTIREEQGMAYYAFSSFDANIGEGPLLVRAGVDPRNVDRAVASIDEEVRKLGAHGPTPKEVAESRDYLIGSLPRLLETNEGIAGFLQLSELFGLGLDYDRRLPALLSAVTVDEVAAAAAEVLHPERASLAIAGPHEAEG